MFSLTATAIDASELRSSLDDARAGALSVFEGRVRDHNDGQAVNRLEYEAYGALALKEGERILEEAKSKFDIFESVCIHRTGVLELGDVAVWVGVVAAHRDAAFSACRYIIDEIKSRVPIWKKEHYNSGDSGWVNCADHAGGTKAQRHDRSTKPQRHERGAKTERHARAARPEHTLDFTPANHQLAAEWRLDIFELSSAEIGSFEIVDIREPDEDPSQILRSLLRKDVLQMPLSKLDVDQAQLNPEKQYLFVCQRGARSDKLVARLRSLGFSNAFWLAGGVEAVRRKFIA